MENHYLYLGPKYKEAVNAFSDYLGNSSKILELETKMVDIHDKDRSYLFTLIEQAKKDGDNDLLEELIRKKKEADRKNNKEIQKEITEIIEEINLTDSDEQKYLKDKIKRLNKKRRGYKYKASGLTPTLMGDGTYIWGGLLWGTSKVYDHCIKNKYNYYWIDNGYLIPDMIHASTVRGKEGKKKTSRHKTGIVKIIKNGFHASKLVERPDDRLNKFFKNALQIPSKSISKDYGYILICPPSDDYQKVFGFTNWLDKTIKEVKKYTDREIKIREKKIRKTIPLIDDLMGAYCTVAPASGVSIESILFGVPTFCSDFSPAAPVGNLDLSKINEPWFPGEELIYKWLCHLSYCQFSIDEIKDGTAWNILNNDI